MCQGQVDYQVTRLLICILQCLQFKLSFLDIPFYFFFRVFFKRIRNSCQLSLSFYKIASRSFTEDTLRLLKSICVTSSLFWFPLLPVPKRAMERTRTLEFREKPQFSLETKPKRTVSIWVEIVFVSQPFICCLFCLVSVDLD